MATSKPGAHTIYKTADGTRVPGATTIIGILDKPALVKWANNLGLQGIDSTRYVDNLASVGTLAHHLILCHYKGEVPDMTDFTENQIELAQNCIQSYSFWEGSHKIEPVLIEEPIVSEILKYGGTPDLYCKMDGVLTLLDFKTGKALYTEVMYQLAAYRNLLNEYGYPVDQCMALKIGRSDDEGFEVKIGKDMDTAFSIFKHCLDLYYLIRDYKKENK